MPEAPRHPAAEQFDRAEWVQRQKEREAQKHPNPGPATPVTRLAGNFRDDNEASLATFEREPTHLRV